MEIEIFDDYGIEIFKRMGRYFMRIDSGELASRPVEAEISMEDAILAQKGAQAAHDVLIKYDKMGSFKNVRS